MHVRRAKLADLATIKQLSRKYKFEPSRNWKEAITSNDKEMFVLVDKGEIKGFTGFIYSDWNNTIQIMDIFIDPVLRGRGIGGEMVKFLIGKAMKTNYRCLIAEAPARGNIDKFYRAAGFRKCGYNDRYYSNRDKRNIAIWMCYDLK